MLQLIFSEIAILKLAIWRLAMLDHVSFYPFLDSFKREFLRFWTKYPKIGVIFLLEVSKQL